MSEFTHEYYTSLGGSIGIKCRIIESEQDCNGFVVILDEMGMYGLIQKLELTKITTNREKFTARFAGTSLERIYHDMQLAGVDLSPLFEVEK